MASLLIGHSGTSWREWLKKNRKGRDLVVLDPGEPTLAPGGQLVLYRGEKPLRTHFFGSLDANRSPHVLIAAAADFATVADSNALYQLAPYSPGPLSHQTVHLLAHLILKGEGHEILVAEGTPIEQSGFPVGPQSVTLEAAFPQMVQAAQRKAQWLAFFERAESQTLELGRMAIEGGRLGAGTRLSGQDLPHGALYGEKAGASLFLVSAESIPDEEIARSLDHHHATRVHVAHPEDYAGLFVGLTRENGEDFALGIVQQIDFRTLRATVISDAVPPAPARLLRLGSIKVTQDGPEPQETKPWSL